MGRLGVVEAKLWSVSLALGRGVKPTVQLDSTTTTKKKFGALRKCDAAGLRSTKLAHDGLLYSTTAPFQIVASISWTHLPLGFRGAAILRSYFVTARSTVWWFML